MTEDSKKPPNSKGEGRATERDYLLRSQENYGETVASSHAEEHRFLDTITEGAERMADYAHDIYDAVAEEAHEIQDTFMDELEHNDAGDTMFFEMGLTRNLSILPSDLQEAADHQKHESKEGDETKPVLPLTGKEEPEAIPCNAYITLLLAVIALSSIGPSLAMQNGVNPIMKIFWRMTGTWMFLLPFALRSVMKDGLPTLNKSHGCTFLFAACSYAVMCVSFVVALEYTSVGNAVIGANSQAVLLLAGKLFVGSRIQFLEGVGALVAFGGAILCCMDGSASTTRPVEEGEASPLWSVWGDLLALLAGLGGCFYLIFAKSVRGNFSSVYVFMFCNMFTASCTVLIYMLLSGEKVSFNRDIGHGMYGFLNLQYDRLPLELFMVVICNMTGSLGYVRSMQYFDNLIISVATLLEPVVASFLAYFIHVGLLPGVVGWVGNVLVAMGTICVIFPSAKKGESTGH